MSSDPLSAAGLRPVALSDRPAFDARFAALREPLSDYTFSQVYTWRNSLRLGWAVLRGHLCVFANGSGDLTLLLPPIGDTGSDAALRDAFDLMDTYNRAHGVPTDRGRVEYLSDELAGRFTASGLTRAPMGNDYLYDTARMIDLAGGDLKSKRQERTRFARDYAHRVEDYDPARHLGPCLALLTDWHARQDARHADEPRADHAKRHKESLATELALREAPALGLTGLVVYVGDRVGGFTFGEPLGADQASVVVEKTDLGCKGLAQFIFSEFCRRSWAHRPRVNAGDDWGLETLAWTKMSYRPVKLLPKFSLRRAGRVSAPVPTVFAAEPPTDAGGVVVRAAREPDIPAAVELENRCFDTYNLTRRQLRYLQGRPTVVFLVAEVDGRVAGEAIALVRQHRDGQRGARLYSLAVDPQRRGRGIGRALLVEMLERLDRRGVRRVTLEVEASNATAVGLYARVGFAASGALPDYYGPGRHGTHMTLDRTAGAAAPRSAA